MSNTAQIAIVMGSKSDWATMQEATQILDELNVAYHVEVVSAHRTPDKLFEFAENAQKNGYKVIIAGAGGAAHLPGMIAAKTLVPVLGVPVKSSMLSGVDSLYSIVQMPKGIPVGTLAIGPAGAANADYSPHKFLQVGIMRYSLAYKYSAKIKPIWYWIILIHVHKTPLNLTALFKVRLFF